MMTGEAREIALAWALLVASCARTAPEPGPAATLPPRPAASVSQPAAASLPPAPDQTRATTEALPAERQSVLPGGFVWIAESGETRCGELRVEVLPEPGGEHEHFVRVLGPRNERVYEAHGRKYRIEQVTLQADLWADWCGDLTGDKVPELLLTERTIGAHCCYTHYAVSLGTTPRRLLMWEKGDSSAEVFPVKYREGQVWQIQSSIVMYPPFNVDQGDPVLSYASMPIVPVVFTLLGGEYWLTSLSFPAAYRKDRDAQRAACPSGADDCLDAVRIWIDSLALGDWAKERANFTDQQLVAALDRRSAAMKQMLDRQLGSLQRPARTH